MAPATRIALHLAHPETGLRIEECVYFNHLVLRANGECFRGRIGGRMGNSEDLLQFNWWTPQHGFRADVISITRFVGGNRTTEPGEPMLHNGEKTQSAVLKVGDRLEWRDTVILVKDIANPGSLVREQAERGRTNDTTLEVFADWLEANGAPTAAEYTRGVIHKTERERMEVLARQLPLSLRALIARGPIERCDRSCDQRWESLAIGKGDTWLKRCGTCKLDISWCDNPQYMSGRGPLVFCPSARRTSGDLYPVHVVG
ncbi:MAG: hypothetical protein QM817_09445 [Archangium sp.]